MLDQIHKILEDHERRLKALEGKKSPSPTPKKEENFTGLFGGLRLLLREGFLDTLKSVAEIEIELRRQGYHYPQKSISKALLVDFMKRNQLLTRIKEGKVWKYARRK